MSGGIHVGDVGTQILCKFRNPDDSAFDVSTAVTKQITLAPPTGNTVTKAGAFVTNGADGQLTCNLAANDITLAGNWYAQGHVIFANGAEYHSDRVRFRVYANNP